MSIRVEFSIQSSMTNHIRSQRRNALIPYDTLVWINMHNSYDDNLPELYSITNEICYCSICLETSDTDTVKLPCKHMFHKKCINKWIKRKKSCPCCRHIIGI